MASKTKVSDFTFLRKVGRGGFGEVYAARRISTGDVVALKVLDKRKLKKELYRKVRNEVEIHMSLSYPSIVKMHEWFEDIHFMYLVLELCSNGDLHHFLKKRGKPLPEQEARELFAQLVDGVVHLHSHNIVHRDISLNNLLLTKDLTLKISDFGLAKRLSGPTDTHRTVCGTPNFMSPETLSFGGRGFMGDCWSLGCVLYHLLTGELPFEDKGVQEILERVKEGRFHIPCSVSVDARSLIGLLLQANPNNRVTAQDILKHSFMTPSPVLSGDSADSGHGTLDSHEMSEDDLKIKQFLPSFTPLQHCGTNTVPNFLPSIRNSLRMRTRPATTPPGPLRIPRRPELSRVKPECLNTVRLPPRVQQRNGLEVEVCKNGNICLRRKLQTGSEEFAVSGDGLEIRVSSEHTAALTMSYSTLQPRWYSRYSKLVHCVNALKASTPKITIHTETASVYYMENGPDPNYQVTFKDGIKLVRDKTRCCLTDRDRTVHLATQDLTPCLSLAPHLIAYLDTSRQLYQQCTTVEKCLGEIEGVVFPVRMGVPPKTQGSMTESTQSSSYLSQMPCSIASSTRASHLDSSYRLVSSTPQHSASLRRSPSVGSLARSPLTPIQCRRALSESPTKRGVDKENHDSNNTTVQNDDEFVKYKPGVGWLGYSSEGARLRFKDKSELILQEDGHLLFKSTSGQMSRPDLKMQREHEESILELQQLLSSL